MQVIDRDQDQKEILEGYDYVVSGVNLDPDAVSKADTGARGRAELGLKLMESFEYAAARRGVRIKPGNAYASHGLFSFQVSRDVNYEDIAMALVEAAEENKTSLIMGLAPDLLARAANTKKGTPDQEIRPYAIFDYQVT